MLLLEPPERRDIERDPPTSLLAGLIDMAEEAVGSADGGRGVVKSTTVAAAVVDSGVAVVAAANSGSMSDEGQEESVVSSSFSGVR